jgi:cation-transporting ATPase E
MPTIQGLTEREVLAARQRGEGNEVDVGISRSYWNILSANLFNFFNLILFAVGIILIVFGRTNDAFITVITALISTLIRTFQEVRAKRQLDRIALLVHPAVTVRRDGVEQTVAASLLVKGDLIHLCAGDQALADGADLLHRGFSAR